MRIEKVTIIGLGALGALIGKQIYDQLGHNAVRFLASPERIQRYRSEGFICNGESVEFEFITPDSKDAADLVIFAVKAPTLDDAIREAANQIGKDTVVLSVLNGISSEGIIAETYGWERVLYSVAQGMDATKFGNRLTYSRAGQILFGDRDDRDTPAVRAVAEFFTRAGVAYTIPENIRHVVWNKFMLNVGVNQATAAYRTNYGGINCDGEPRETMLAAMREVIPIAAAEGVTLTEDDVQAWLNVLAPFKEELMPSLAQDTVAKRKTEVELFSGTVLRLAKKNNLDAPVNQWLYDRIIEIEKSYGA